MNATRIRTAIEAAKYLGSCVFLFGLASSLSAGVISQHVGATDPESVGWIGTGNTENFGPVINDLGTTDAWMIDNLGQVGDCHYEYPISQSQANEALKSGWGMRIQARLIDVPDHGHQVWFANGARRYILDLSTNATGDPVISVGPDGSMGEPITIKDGAGQYHLYEMRDSDATGAADVLIDGELVFPAYTGDPAPGVRTLIFGDPTSSATLSGTVNYSLVVLESFRTASLVSGDYDNSGEVEQSDLDLVLLSWGDDSEATGVPEGWVQQLPNDPGNRSSVIDQEDLDGVLLNWGDTVTSVSVVPEPTSLMLLLAGIAIASLRGHHVLNRVGC